MELAVVITFIIGYVAIALEHPIKVNKTATALITGVLCWTIYICSGAEPKAVEGQLLVHVAEISKILFFLLGAMTIVELIDAHDGFQIITDRIKTNNIRILLWIIGIITFFLSSILDNLTTAIVMMSLLRKIIANREQRLLFAGIVIIAANAGGAWSPIGDVTTTMLWSGGQVSPLPLIKRLFLPSFVCMALPLAIVTLRLKGSIVPTESIKASATTSASERTAVFLMGILALLFVPVFHTFTHLPPFMAILLGLGVMWVVTEFMNHEKDTEDKESLSVVSVLRKIDTSSILFFLGILMSVAALEATGLLVQFATLMQATFGNQDIIVILIGLLSAIVDNVPLVAATQGMYPLKEFPMDHHLWQFLAFTAGTGGSILIIGSAAGVAIMGTEKIEFFWYLKHVAWLALLGFLAGSGVYLLMG